MYLFLCIRENDIFYLYHVKRTEDNIPKKFIHTKEYEENFRQWETKRREFNKTRKKENKKSSREENKSNKSSREVNENTNREENGNSSREESEKSLERGGREFYYSNYCITDKKKKCTGCELCKVRFNNYTKKEKKLKNKKERKKEKARLRVQEAGLRVEELEEAVYDVIGDRGTVTVLMIKMI